MEMPKLVTPEAGMLLRVTREFPAGVTSWNIQMLPGTLLLLVKQIDKKTARPQWFVLTDRGACYVKAADLILFCEEL